MCIEGSKRLQVAARKTLLGEGAMVKGHSLGMFGITNKYRLATFRLLYSQVRNQSFVSHKKLLAMGTNGMI